ncbi:MAG: CinA family protein [Thermodesulfovibrionales bacterium]|nr:CinA family protein [Thermodesulfovibrionales bacterium]
MKALVTESLPLSIVERVHTAFRKRGLKLSIAESCTGGLISHYITSLPGASLFFEAGAVTYSIKAKGKILGIYEDSISRFGVISREIAALMASSIMRITGSDFGLSTTGNLGPDVLEGKERGLVYIGVAHKDKTWTKELRLSGDRMDNKEKASLKALEFLVEIMEESSYG